MEVRAGAEGAASSLDPEQVVEHGGDEVGVQQARRVAQAEGDDPKPLPLQVAEQLDPRPGTPGVLVAKRSPFRNEVPAVPAGGTIWSSAPPATIVARANAGGRHGGDRTSVTAVTVCGRYFLPTSE